MTRTAMLSVTAALAAVASGCASQGPKPTEQLTRARTVVEQADKAGVQRYAAADLQRAHDELADADKANTARRYDEARRYAEAAEADADVATARAGDGEAQRAAHELRLSSESLQNETERTSPATTPPTSVPPPTSAAPPATTTVPADNSPVGPSR